MPDGTPSRRLALLVTPRHGLQKGVGTHTSIPPSVADRGRAVAPCTASACHDTHPDEPGRPSRPGQQDLPGNVLSVKPETVATGGGELPILVYRVRVEERFKGEFGEGKTADFVEIRMVGAAKEDRTGHPPGLALARRAASRSGPGVRVVHHHAEPHRPLHHRGTGPGRLPDPGRRQGRAGGERLRQRGSGQGVAAVCVAPAPVPYGELAQAIRSVLGE